MLYVLYGPDSFSLREWLQHLKVELDSDGMLESNTVVFEARQATPQEVIAVCDALPFLSSRRLVVVAGLLSQAAASAPGPRQRRRAAPAGRGEPWLALAEYAERMPPTTTLVLLDGEVPPGNPLLEAFRGKGEAREFRLPEQRALPAWVERRAQGMGLKIDKQAARLLAELVGPNLWLLAGELEKLAAYAAGQPVKEEDVRTLVSAAREVSVFALVDAIVEGRPAAALRLLRQMLAQGENAPYVFAMVQRQYRRLAVAREMIDAGLGDRAVGERLGVFGYGLERLLDQASRYSLPRIKAAFRRLLETDAGVKRGVHDDELALETLVQELAAPGRAA